MKVAILGSTGYTGMMLMRILACHPDVSSIVPISRSAAGRPVTEVDPGLAPSITHLLASTGGRFAAIEDGRPDTADVVFSAMPHGAAAEIVGPLVGSVPIIDLSADFRLGNAGLYEAVYATRHPCPDMLGRAVYGLSEWHGEQIANAQIVACPGCYPTATLLPLLPFAGLAAGPAIVNALSGISGAGRKEAQNLLFNERSENMNAYNPGRSHRHVSEIEQELARQSPLEVLFTPHLVPVKQGMIVTTTVRLTAELAQQEAENLLRDAYRDAPFVTLSPRGIPESRDVRNTNRCDLGVRVCGSHVQLFSAIDNLYKGASGQAVQNMNIRLGLEQTAGLRVHGEF